MTNTSIPTTVNISDIIDFEDGLLDDKQMRVFHHDIVLGENQKPPAFSWSSLISLTDEIILPPCM